MIKTYQYRIYPTFKQAKILLVWLKALRNLYNQGLSWRKEVYNKTGESVNWVTQANALPKLRQASSTFGMMHIDVLQDTLRRLDKAYQVFSRRVQAGEAPGFPRFKSVSRYRSMTFSHLSKKLICNIRKWAGRIIVPKVGHVAIRYHRLLPDGKIRHLTIQRKASGWYANIAVEIPDVLEVKVKTTIGADVGIESFLTASDGDKVHNPQYFRESEKKLTKAQRILSRREKGSTRYKEQCEEVTVEDLKIGNMVKNPHLVKSISDAAWGNFQLILQSKAANAGKQLTKVDPKYTSQSGNKHPRNPRFWDRSAKLYKTRWTDASNKHRLFRTG